jgi:hypothetical protein
LEERTQTLPVIIDDREKTNPKRTQTKAKRTQKSQLLTLRSQFKPKPTEPFKNKMNLLSRQAVLFLRTAGYQARPWAFGHPDTNRSLAVSIGGDAKESIVVFFPDPDHG